MRILSLTALILLASGAPLLAPPAETPGLACTLEMLHPIQVQVRLVDAMTPGRWLRAEVQVQSERDLADVTVQLQADAGVEIGGRGKTSWTALAAATPQSLGFDVRVPDGESPRQLRVAVRGRTDGVWLERGAVLQLLPRGRMHATPVSAAGGRTVLEHRGAARREP
jgi:hypothetical protein